MGRKRKQQKKYKKRKYYKLISTILGVIVIPVMLTIVLAAFEDTTNEWVMRLRGNEPVVVKTKRLAEEGQLIYQECASLGMKYQEVLENCPQPVYRLTAHQTEKPYGLLQQLRIKGEERRKFTYTFSEETLVSMEVADPAFTSIPFSKVKETFEDLDNTGLDQKSQYTYQVSAEHTLTFIYDSDTKELRSIRLEARKLPQKNNPPFVTLTRQHQVALDKEIQLGSLSAIQRLQPLIQAGDLLAYDCGPLGTDYKKVINQCGEPVIWSEEDMEKKKRQVRYEYRNRRITLSFHQDQLSRIDVEKKDAPWTIQSDEVKQVFGEPIKTENTDGEKLYYRVEQNVVIFTFSDQAQLTTMTVADDSFLKIETPAKFSDVGIDEKDLIY